MLKNGIVKTAIGASDSHRPDSKSIIAHPQTVVYAKGLNRKAIISGIREGRCYLAENSNISLSLKVSSPGSKRSASIGDTLSALQKNKFSVRCKIRGLSDSSMVIFISNKGIEHVFNNVKSNAPALQTLPITSLILVSLMKEGLTSVRLMVLGDGQVV